MREIDGKTVLPGDDLAYSIEFAGGENTYEEKGKIRSAAVGTARMDMEDRVVRVEASNPIVQLREGDTVIGVVKDLRKTLAMIDIIKVAGRSRHLSDPADGVVHVSKVRKEFVEDVRKELHLRDIVRCKVLQVSPSIQLSTMDDDLGVLKAMCDRCGDFLRVDEGKLYCSSCERYHNRKRAPDYGEGHELPEGA